MVLNRKNALFADHAGWTAPDGICCAKLRVLKTQRGDRPSCRLSQSGSILRRACFNSRGGWGRPRRRPEAARAKGDGELLREASALRRGVRGLRHVALLGPNAPRHGARGPAFAGGLCEAVRQAQQDRCARRGGDLRGGGAPRHPAGSGKERRAAGLARSGAVARIADQAAHAIDEQLAGDAGRVRGRGGSGLSWLCRVESPSGEPGERASGDAGRGARPSEQAIRHPDAGDRKARGQDPASRQSRSGHAPAQRHSGVGFITAHAIVAAIGDGASSPAGATSPPGRA